MSTPLYYTDSYLTDFEATVVESFEENGRFGHILSQTAFYATSGGQPHDKGTLNGVDVIDVTFRKADNGVVHWTKAEIEAGVGVNGRIHWQRRFDHMQQHTGQHMLSQAFIQLADAPTLSFHLSPNSVTIDIEKDDLTDAQISEVEQYVNQIVWENRPVAIESVTLAEAQARDVRKLPPTVREKVRLVNITDFDLTACGGTHVASTGAVGLIKIIKAERQNKKGRITFACGSRALADYGDKNNITNALMQQFTTGLDDLVPNLTKLQTDLKAANKTNSQLQNELLRFRATQLRANAERVGEYNVAIHLMTDGSPQGLPVLANALLDTPQTVAMLGFISGSKTQLLFGCSEDVTLNMSELLKGALAKLGDGSGGGRPNMARGGTAVIDLLQLTTTFEEAFTSFSTTV